MRAAGLRLPPRGAKRVGDEVRLRALWWDGPAARVGDLLRTSTGRCYLIVEIGVPRPPGVSFSIRAMVMPEQHAAPEGCSEFRWTWTRKARRVPKAFAR